MATRRPVFKGFGTTRGRVTLSSSRFRHRCQYRWGSDGPYTGESPAVMDAASRRTTQSGMTWHQERVIQITPYVICCMLMDFKSPHGDWKGPPPTLSSAAAVFEAKKQIADVKVRATIRAGVLVFGDEKDEPSRAVWAYAGRLAFLDAC